MLRLLTELPDPFVPARNETLPERVRCAAVGVVAADAFECQVKAIAD